MAQLRIIIGFTAMLLFVVSVVIWITMVLVPILTGGQVQANLETLVFWTLATLAVWRLGAGKGWGFLAQPEK